MDKFWEQRVREKNQIPYLVLDEIESKLFLAQFMAQLVWNVIIKKGLIFPENVRKSNTPRED